MEGSAERRCAFCERPIPKNAPPEHVVPKWMGKFRLKHQVLQQTTGPELRGSVEYPRPTDAPDRISKKFELTADTICKDCNHHWMSDLETVASLLLTPMIEGETTGLSISQQALLAAWVTKTTLTWDQSMRPENRFQPQWLYPWLYKHSKPHPPLVPPGVTVRLGRYEGPHELMVEMAHDAMYLAVPPNPDDPGPPDANRTIIRVKQLVMEFVCTRDTEPRVALFKWDVRPMVVTIWPAIDRTLWPPVSLDRATLDDFVDATRLSRPG